MPPTTVMVSASARNWKRMSRRRPPSAFSTPISRVRWVTDTSMMFIRPTPPMPSVSVPMKPSRILQAHGDDLELVQLLHHVEDEDRRACRRA